MKRWGVIVLCLAMVLGATGVGLAKDLTFFVIAHAGPGDPFWAVVQRGVQDAGKQLGVKAVFQGPASHNVPEQVNMFKAAVAAGAAGIATTISDPKAWAGPIADARDQGIAVVAINVKEPPEFKAPIPYMAYIGMDEYEAGKTIARRAAGKLPAKSRVVVAIHQPGHVGLEARAKGIKEVLEARGAVVEKLDITEDPTQAIGILRSYLKAHADTKAIITLGPLGLIPTIKMAREDGLKGKVLIESFDLDPVTCDAIRGGFVDSSVDQQQYLQGYMAVVQLYLYAKYGLEPADYDTARGLVTAQNVDLVQDLVKAGVR
ncbi:MAG: substrate-binding domain-containing protein [Methanocella sp.]